MCVPCPQRELVIHSKGDFVYSVKEKYSDSIKDRVFVGIPYNHHVPSVFLPVNFS